MSSLSLGKEPINPIVPINFQQLHDVKLERKWIDLKVFHTILPDALDEQKEMRGTDGYVYILEDENQPGYVKIGMTKDHPYNRSKKIQHCKAVHPVLIDGQAVTLVTCYKRLERIIFADLWNERQIFPCDCRSKTHVEWFKMSKEDALSRVKLWQDWMCRKPYNSLGVLRPKWERRIQKLQRDSSYAETTEAEHTSGKPWQTFMAEFPDPAPS